jgi:hypothetical protein
VHFADGTNREASTRDAHGTPADPCTPQERIWKFSRLAELAELGIATEKVISSVEGLASGLSARELTATLTPAY